MGNMDGGCDLLAKRLRLRYQEKSCANCRYYRVLDGDIGDCLLLGRMMAIGLSEMHQYVAFERVCDGWKRIPRTWDCRVVQNPFLHDPYISRESQERIRERAYNQRSYP